MNEKKNDFFSFFNGSQKKKETKKIIFDENFFNIQVNGGKIHSDKIIIEAIQTVDNEKLETDIKWFQISPNNDFNTLGITGNSYQPSIEDVGSKFMIQVVPIKEGRQYEGMPKSLEIGPLIKDESIQEEIDELLDNEKMTVFVTLEQIISKDFEIEAELPINCILKITLKNMELDLKRNDQIIHHIQIPLQAQYPQCSSKQGTNESFILKVDQTNHFQMRAADNSQRDIILTVIKGFYGKGIWKDQEIQEQEESEDENEQEDAEQQKQQELELKIDENLIDKQQDQDQHQVVQDKILKEQCQDEMKEIELDQLNDQTVEFNIIKKENEQQVIQIVQNSQYDQSSELPQPTEQIELTQTEQQEQDNQFVQNNDADRNKQEELDQESLEIIQQNVNIENQQNNQVIEELNKPLDSKAIITRMKSDELTLEVDVSKNQYAINNQLQQNNDITLKEHIKQEQQNEQQQQIDQQQSQISQNQSQSQQIEKQEQQTKEIENKQQINNIISNEENNQVNKEEQSQVKQRTEHKFQSVIIASENNKEEKTSPVKKKEKKNNMDLYIQINENVKLKQDIEKYKLGQQKDQEIIQQHQKQIQTLQFVRC